MPKNSVEDAETKPSPSKKIKVESFDEDSLEINIKEEEIQNFNENITKFEKEGKRKKNVGSTLRQLPTSSIFDMVTGTIPTPHDFSSFPKETDQGVLERRYKQLKYGKSTEEYAEYRKAVPKTEREPHQPRTPNMYRKYSRRAWDGLVKQWRCKLHLWNKSESEMEVLIGKYSNTGRISKQSFESGSTRSTNSVSENESNETDSNTPSTIKKEATVKQETSWYDDCLDLEADEDYATAFLTLPS